MSEKEIKKIDDENEGKVSGGAKVDKNNVREVLAKSGVDPKRLDEILKNLNQVPMHHLAYGGPSIGIGRKHHKPPIEVSQPKEPAEPLAPANPVKPEK